MNPAAAQAHHNACAKTRLGMSLHHLEVARDKAKAAGMRRQANTIDRWISEQTEAYDAWPTPTWERNTA